MGSVFFVNSIILGIGLAMDAFTVSIANGLTEGRMGRQKRLLIAGTFGLFQTGMPLLGWLLVHVLLTAFEVIQHLLPWISLILLVFLGIRMILHGLAERKHPVSAPVLGGLALLVQGVATSIDALSVGFVIAKLSFPFAFAEALIIGLVTFALCLIALHIGKKIGTKVNGLATILGGLILIGIGIRIFFS